MQDTIIASKFHSLVPTTATEIKFLYASDNLTDYQKLGYCDNNNFIEVWNSGTKYIIINPRNNSIYAPVSCNSFLNGYNKLTTCIFDNFDTRNVTNMQYMFCNCNQLTSLDLSSFNTQNVTNMQYMFYNCSSLTSLDLSSFNTQKVTNMQYMFYTCNRLKSLDLSSFNTQKVTVMAYMFFDCKGLTSLDLSSFNTQEVTLFLFMFYGCDSLTTLIGVLDISSAINFAGFAVYAKFRNISFTGNPTHCTTFNDMFALCNRLTTIYSQTFTIRAGATSSGMFSGCSSLVGGNGTTYSSSHINAEYARVDGENGLAGYFTAPAANKNE